MNERDGYNSAGADLAVLTDDEGEVDINRLFGDSDGADFGARFGLSL